MMTMFHILDEFLDHMRSLNFSRYTIRTYHFNVKRTLRWLRDKHGIITPENLRVSHLHAWQKHISRQTATDGRSLKARSLNKRIENMRGFLDYMVKKGFVQARLIEAVEYVKEPKELPGSVLTHEQMRKLLESVDADTTAGYCLRTMLEVMYSSGIRVGELLGMNTNSVDLSNRTALVTGKGNKDRVVPVGRTALSFLENYIKAVRPYLAVDNDEKALFLDGSGRRMPYHILRQRIINISEKAGLEVHVTAHTFRRSCTTELLRGGAGMYHVKELLGHESLQSIKHYAKLTILDLKETHKKCHPRERDAKD